MRPIFMFFRRPQDALISGVGVAGAVLAAVVVTFALVSGFVAYSFTSVDPLSRSSDALVLGPLRADTTAAEPLVLRRAVQRRSVPATGTAAPANRRTGEPALAALSPQGGAGAGAKTEPEPEPERHADDVAAPPAHPAPDRLLQPVGDAIDATGEARDATTESLARRIDAVTAAAAAAVGETPDVLRTTVDRSGRVVGRLLGDSPPR
jgi:hypothetical protein